MSTRPGPDWLAALQARFGSVLRMPLDRETGTLRATASAYDAEALHDVLDGPRASAADRLAVYNRQYWFRLFGVLQTAFPLTARLLGHWHFNDVASRFLLAHAPCGWDLELAADGLEAFLAASPPPTADAEALGEAARIDGAWRAVFRAPSVVAFRPRVEDAARLLDARLVPSPAAAIVVEHWPLLALKRSLAHDARDGGESAVALPGRSPDARWWALVREPAGIRQLQLEPREAELLLLLGRHTVRDALAELEAACPPDERASLPAHAQRWLARSVACGLWSALSDDQGRTHV